MGVLNRPGDRLRCNRRPGEGESGPSLSMIWPRLRPLISRIEKKSTPLSVADVVDRDDVVVLELPQGLGLVSKPVLGLVVLTRSSRPTNPP